jgi:hypothetical protein
MLKHMAGRGGWEHGRERELGVMFEDANIWLAAIDPHMGDQLVLK